MRAIASSSSKLKEHQQQQPKRLFLRQQQRRTKQQPRLLPLAAVILFILGSYQNPDCSSCGWFAESFSSAATTADLPSRRSSSHLPSSTTLMSSGNSEETTTTFPCRNHLSVGFIGCGTIASSIVRGMFKSVLDGDEDPIAISNMMVSKRSETKSIALFQELFGKVPNFAVTDNNQQIVDDCDLLFLTVLPSQAQEVLENLKLDPNRHVLVSLVSTATLDDLEEYSKLPKNRVAKMICLPSIAHHRGVALLCCGDGEQGSNVRSFLRNLFDSLGGVVCLETEADLEACMVTTCTMGPLYGTMKHQRDWLLQQTGGRLSAQAATALVVKQFAGAVADAESSISENRLEELIAEQTPGGLNEQALNNYGNVLGGFENIQTPVMDAILNRIRGETDGSILNDEKSKAKESES